MQRYSHVDFSIPNLPPTPYKSFQLHAMPNLIKSTNNHRLSPRDSAYLLFNLHLPPRLTSRTIMRALMTEDIAINAEHIPANLAHVASTLSGRMRSHSHRSPISSSSAYVRYARARKLSQAPKARE